MKETGVRTVASSGSFVPRKPGTYRVWIDVSDATGRTVMVDSTIDVSLGFSYDECKVSATNITYGDSVTVSCDVTANNSSRLTYNYAWAFGESGWDEWSSTVKETGSTTGDTSFSFKPTKAGVYRVWADVADEFGNVVTRSAESVYVDSGWQISSLQTNVESSQKVTLALFLGNGDGFALR